MKYHPKLKGVIYPMSLTWNEMLDMRKQVKGIRWVREA